EISFFSPDIFRWVFFDSLTSSVSMEPSLEEGEVTIPSSSRTIVQDYLEGVIAIARHLFSEYWPDDNSDEDSIEIGSPRKEERDATAKRKGVFGRIFFSFFSPLTRKSIVILSCIAVSLDPLFFYIPIIDEKDKCLGIDKNLRTAALIFRALPDATFALRTIISGYTIYTNDFDDSLGILARTCVCSIIGFVGILIAVSLMLPIPQLAIAVFYFKLGDFGHLGQRVTVSVFLIIYYLARVFLICISSTNNMYRAGKWVRATLNLFFYILASHVLGGFWYFFSIQREISCWYKYCENTKACGATYYCSGSSSRNATFINELCPTNPPNATALNFGIFFDAIESGITRSKHFTTRFLYCLWWGVRNLSNFGTNLQTSSYEWENCFAIVISIIGMLLFLYLLGNLQIYLQHAATKLVDADTKAEELRPKIDGKKIEIRTWMETNNVPPDIVKISQSKLVKHIDDEVDVKFICSVVAD
ncbi:unnamed protein product, partial [Prunus brigantina]